MNQNHLQKSKMKSKERKLDYSNYNIFKGLDWALFIEFCILAGHLMSSVIDHYQEKKTSFTQTLKPITKLPTFAICITSEKNT